MDNVTHALAGLLLADLAVRVLEHQTGAPVDRSIRRTAAVLGVVAAEFPDLDILYSGPLLGMGKLGYLLHHRGHTHTLLLAIAAAVLLWGLAMAAERRVRAGPARLILLGLAMAGTVSHIALDFTNSYGVHPFWPLDNRWFYGDAVFIVEPWLWVLAIPPLLAGQRSVVGRVLLGVALVGILAAAWLMDVVPSPLAAALTVAAVVWLLVMFRVAVAPRLALASLAWVLFETGGFTASRIAHEVVARAVPDGLADVVLTPAAANLLCFNAIVVESDSVVYRVSRATVAVWPAVQRAVQCAGGDATAASAGLRGGLVPPSRATSAALHWQQEWSAPRAELVRLAERCDVQAALGFMRVPVWEIAGDGSVRVSDLRYGFGGDGFADLSFPSKVGVCPPFVPPWTPPRAEEIAS